MVVFHCCSVRQRWNWIPKQGEAGPSSMGGACTGKKAATGPTIILFVVGGMTYSEMRGIYEASATTNNRIIVGRLTTTTTTTLLLLVG